MNKRFPVNYVIVVSCLLLASFTFKHIFTSAETSNLTKVDNSIQHTITKKTASPTNVVKVDDIELQHKDLPESHDDEVKDSQQTDTISQVETQLDEQENIANRQTYIDYMGEPYAYLTSQRSSLHPLLFELITTKPSVEDKVLNQNVSDFLTEFLNEHVDLHTLDGFKCNQRMCEFRVQTKAWGHWFGKYRSLQKSGILPKVANYRNISNQDKTHMIHWLVFEQPST
jgi:hypothetical protein